MLSSNMQKKIAAKQSNKTITTRYFIIWIAIIALFGLFFYFYINKQRLAYEIWEYKTLSFSMSEMTIYDNALIFSDETNHLYSLSLDGNLKWKLDLECPIQNKLMVSEDFIITRTDAAYQTFYPEMVTNCRHAQQLHIIDKQKGELEYIIESDMIYSYTSYDNDIIYSTGRKLFEYRFTRINHYELIFDQALKDNRLRGFSSDFYTKNNTLYMKSMYQDVFAFNLDSRELKWRFTSDWNLEEDDSVDTYHTSDSLIYDEGVIYTVNKVQHSTAADVYAFDAESGVILSRYHIEAGASPGRLSASDTHIYIPSNDARVHALRKQDLMPVWDVTTRGTVRGAMVPYNGVVYAGTQAGGIIGLDEKTGERVYYYPTEHPIPGTPAIKDGIIYFATNGGSIHAVRLPAELTVVRN